MGENNNSNPCLEKAFSRFLEKVAKLKESNIVFTDYYNQNEVPNRIMMEIPLLLDPVNPYNNLLSEKNHHQPNILTKFMKFMEYAAFGCLYVIRKYGFRNVESKFKAWHNFLPHPGAYFLFAPLKFARFGILEMFY